MFTGLFHSIHGVPTFRVFSLFLFNANELRLTSKATGNSAVDRDGFASTVVFSFSLSNCVSGPVVHEARSCNHNFQNRNVATKNGSFIRLPWGPHIRH